MSAVRLTHAIASRVLSYPDEVLFDSLPSLRAATETLPSRLSEPLDLALSYLSSTEPFTVAAHYVETFDLRRRCCLYLTYYTHGDTRRRGAALLHFRQTYQAAEMRLMDGELPDHLAVVLEFSAAGHSSDLLVEHRAGLELLWRALMGLQSPYAHAVAAVRVSLPPPRAGDVQAAHRLAAEGPPAEQVGIR